MLTLLQPSAFLLAATLSVLVATPSFAQTSGSPPPVPEEFEAAVARAERLGQELNAMNQFFAASVGVLQERTSAAEDGRVVGWITLEHDGGPVTRIVGTVGDETVGLYDAKRAADAWEVTVHNPPVVLAPSELALFGAEATAMAAMPFQCAPRYDHVTMQSEDGEGLSVYLLASASDPSAIVVGGNFRVDVSAAGDAVREVVPFSTGCVELDSRQATEPGPDGAMPVGLVVTHILGPTPTEIHSYLTLRHATPIFVVTEAGAWLVEAGQIAFLGALPAAGASSE